MSIIIFSYINNYFFLNFLYSNSRSSCTLRIPSQASSLCIISTRWASYDIALPAFSLGNLLTKDLHFLPVWAGFSLGLLPNNHPRNVPSLSSDKLSAFLQLEFLFPWISFLFLDFSPFGRTQHPICHKVKRLDRGWGESRKSPQCTCYLSHVDSIWTGCLLVHMPWDLLHHHPRDSFHLALVSSPAF